MENHSGHEQPISKTEKNTVPILGKGVYLIEEEYKGEFVYVVYVPNSNFGYRLTEPLYRFLCLCAHQKYSMNQIIDKLLEDFDVEREVLEADLAHCVSNFEKIGIVERNK